MRKADSSQPRAAGLLEVLDHVADAPSTVAKVRAIIVSLAVQGRLVPQDRNDEPAENLVRRIAAERAGMGAKKWLPVDTAQSPYELPISWLWVRLGEISMSSDAGWSPQCLSEPREGDGWGVLKVSAVSWGVFKPEENKALPPGMVGRKDCEVHPGDFLLSRANTEELVARSVVVEQTPQHLMMSDKIVRFTFPAEIIKSFINLANSADFARAYYAKNASGTSSSMKNVGREVMCNLPIPLPPLAEQRRIVAKMDELMALCDRLEAQLQERDTRQATLARAALARFADAPTPANLDLLFHSSFTTTPADLRKTILSLAVQGQLVPQDPNDEPAEKLLGTILATDPTNRSGNSACTENDTEPPFELPPGWAWTTFPKIGELARGKSKHRPRNDPALFTGGKYRLVQTGDVARSNGTIETFTSLYNEKGLAQSRLWPAGTLCITIAANIADSGILAFDACFPDSVVGFLPAKPISATRYFEYFLRTAKEHLEEFAPATAQRNINLEILGNLWIPIPPLAEQSRIVAKVDQLMALVDQWEAQLDAARITADHLLSALVAELTAV